MSKCCRTCKFYTDSYGFKNGIFVGLYSSCNLKKHISIECKKNNFVKWEK
jgi:hypothetical protein